MTSNNTGGRPPPRIVVANFTQLEKVANKSGRYWWKCNHCDDNGLGHRIQGRDNLHVKHLIDPKKCPNCPSNVRKEARTFLAGKGINEVIGGSITSSEASSPALPEAGGSVVVKKRKSGTLGGYVDHAPTLTQQERANVKLFRFVVHANVAFTVAENWYFHDFLDEIRPSYQAPSRWVLSHSIMDAEAARVQIEEINRLKERKQLTLLIDGWEDKIKRSLYGSVAAEVNRYPVVLSLDDLTGHQGSADKLFETSQKALKTMEIEDGHCLIALTTDNPTVMQALRRRFQGHFYWVLVCLILEILELGNLQTFACFLHGLNTTLGEICSFPAMKKIISRTTRIVTFFNNSHYWGGQLNSEAKKMKINRTMKQNCESRWYALILQGLSVLSYRNPLSHICVRPDAQKKTHRLSPVVPEVINTVLHDREYWSRLNQLLKTAKPIVDAIGNLESRETSLADCMLELIRCARAMTRIQLDPDDDDVGFWMHAKAVFNRRFHSMNTNIHSLALFLHPMCRKLAISQAANGRSFEFMVQTALGIAQQWRWSEEKAKRLVDNLKQYHQCRGPYAGGQANGLDWWECLPLTAEANPLKILAITLFSIVPHAAEVERLFSALGGTQTVKRCRLSVETFETLGKLRANYCYHLYQKDRASGKPTHRRHAHMHTHSEVGISVDLVNDLEATFTWTPPLTSENSEPDDFLQGPEGISLDELDKAFRELENQSKDFNESLDGGEVLQGEVYSFEELERVDQGLIPESFKEVVSVIGDEDAASNLWDVRHIMTSEGVSFL